MLIGGLVVVGAFVLYAKYDQSKVIQRDDIVLPNSMARAKPLPVTTVIAQTVSTDTYVLKWIEAKRSRDDEKDRIKITFELQNLDSKYALIPNINTDFVLHSADNIWYHADSLLSGGNVTISYPNIYIGQPLRGTLNFELPSNVAIASISYLEHTNSVDIPILSN